MARKVALCRGGFQRCFLFFTALVITAVEGALRLLRPGTFTFRTPTPGKRGQ